MKKKDKFNFSNLELFTSTRKKRPISGVSLVTTCLFFFNIIVCKMFSGGGFFGGKKPAPEPALTSLGRLIGINYENFLIV